MNGLDSATDLSFFLGQSLTEVGLGKYDVQLHFDKGLAVQIESSAELTLPDGTDVKIPRIGMNGVAGATGLHVLLGKDVVGVSVLGKGDLCIVFDGGEKLVLFDDAEYYECYNISMGSLLIVV